MAKKGACHFGVCVMSVRDMSYNILRVYFGSV